MSITTWAKNIFDDVIIFWWRHQNIFENPNFLENSCNFQMLIKNLLKHLLKFSFRILKDKRCMYNISDGFQDFENKNGKNIPKFQVKIWFLRNRVKIGKPGLPGIKILRINFYYHLKHVWKVSSHKRLYFGSSGI